MEATTNTDITKMISDGCSRREFAGAEDGRRTSILIHREAGKAVGYVMFSHAPDSPSVHVGWVAVETEQRRHGVGTRLMQRVIGAATGWDAEEITLHVRVSNSGAIMFYRTLGFKVARRVEDHYGDEDAWRMRRELR
jgi:ribosomal protein S18 acetylase RimI-like enzyme